MTIEELLKDAKDWWKQHAEREMEKKETLVSRFETAVKRMEQLHTLVNVDKRWSIKVSNKVPAVPWRNDIGASGLMISPQNGTDLANVSISANGVTYTFPAGSTAATVIPLGLPGDVITISGTSATMAVMDLRALGQEETLRFLMRPFDSTVIVGNTVNTLTQLTGSNAQGQVLPLATRTGGLTSAQFIAPSTARGLALFLNVTAASGTGGLSLFVNFYDPVSNQYGQVALISSVIAISITGSVVYPTAVNAGWAAAATSPLTPTWAAEIQTGDSSSYTYSLGYAYLS